MVGKRQDVELLPKIGEQVVYQFQLFNRAEAHRWKETQVGLFITAEHIERMQKERWSDASEPAGPHRRAPITPGQGPRVLIEEQQVAEMDRRPQDRKRGDGNLQNPSRRHVSV